MVQSSGTSGGSPTPVSITTTTLAAATVQASYAATLAATGGTAPYLWSVVSGTLPAGLSLTASSGQISGTPTQAGTVSFSVQVVDSSATPQKATQALTITVSVTSVSISTTSLPNGQEGTAYTTSLAANGGTTPYSWSIASGSLPTGLTLAASNGTVSGTPTSSGTFSFTVQATDSTKPTAETATKALSITIAANVTALSVTTTSLPGGQQGAAYTATITATGGTTPYSWSISSGSLPAGLSLSAASGLISGTPTASGTFTFTAQVVDSTAPTAQSATKAFSISVGAVTSNSPVISPSVPVANQGASVTFTCILNCGTGGTWSCINCAGSILPSTGIYAAPATVMPQQMSGGYQLLPNNHIYNVAIASLPVDASSASMISGFGNSNFKFELGWPINNVNNSTPSVTESFWYPDQPGNLYDGPFQVPAYPYARIETGWLSAVQYNPFSADHHLVTLNTQTGQIQEMYQQYPAGTEVSQGVDSCSSCTSRSGVKYNASDYALPGYYNGGTRVGSTDAAGLQLWPLTLRLQEVEQAAEGCPSSPGVVHHALRFTTNLGALNGSFVWPATATISVSGGANPFGARLRLKSSFDISGYSCMAQVILKTLQQYGMFLADVGTNMAAQVEYTRWPYAYAQALGAIGNANITPANFEVVDESSLMINPNTGLANTGREAVTYTASTGSASVDVALMGTAVTMDKDIVYVQAGAPQMQFVAYSNLGGVTWSMNPSVGTLTTGGLYTPPSTATAPSSTTVTATSTFNPSVSASMTVVIYPSGGIYLAPGRTSNYTDSHGNVWLAGPLYGGSDAANTFTTLSAFGYSNGGSWPSTPDIALYQTPIYAANDIRFDIWVPNGTYTIDAKFANNSGSSSSQGNFVIEAQGVAGPSSVDIYSLVGNNQPYDSTTTVTVTNGLLSFVVRTVNTTGNRVAPFISALQITPN